MIDIHIPKMGMSTVEVDVIAIPIASGTHVEVGDPLLEVESEKVEMTIDSEVAGTIREVFVVVDGTYEVGHVFCTIEPDPA